MRNEIDNPALDQEFDYAIVGGGSAGCVLASRLSADSRRSVVVIEAGAGSGIDQVGCPLRDASRLVLEGYNWDYEADIIRGRPNGGTAKSSRPFPYRLGKVLGGSSSVNGAVALIGFPSDFDKWAAMGCPDWHWKDVEPWFRAVDGCAEEAADTPVKSPLRPRLPSKSQLHPLDKGFIKACEAAGVTLVDRINSGEGPAVGLAPANVGAHAERISVWQSYLEPHINRPNLHIISRAEAARIVVVDGRAAGVEVDLDERRRLINAHNVIVCAGAIGTPLLLQRSGIGDADDLRSFGISLVAHLPAVGRNLADHASVVLWATPKAQTESYRRPWRQVVARVKSGVDEEVDVQLGLLNNVASDAVPAMRDRIDNDALIGATVMLMRPKARGRVCWRGRQQPLIELPLTADETDVARLCGGVRQMWHLLQNPALRENVDGVRFWSDAVIRNDHAMISAISNLANPGWHACGTARMGRPDDPETVVGQDGRVHGVDGLFVADASLFPTIPSMPTNLAVVMSAERLSVSIANGNRP